MGDLLIRDLDPDTKSKLLESARRGGRSLLEEAALRLRLSLVGGHGPRPTAGQRLRTIIDGFELTESERAQIVTSRHEKDRPPPALDTAS